MRRVTKKLRQEIKHLYYVEGLSTTEIAKKYELTEWKVDEILGRL